MPRDLPPSDPLADVFSVGVPSGSPFSHDNGLFTLSIYGRDDHNRYAAFNFHAAQRLFVLSGSVLASPPVHVQGRTDKDKLTLDAHQDAVITDATNQCQSARSPSEKKTERM